MRTAWAYVCLASAAAALFADEPPSGRRLELRASDVGRLALENDPGFRVRQLDPAIARTRIDEALGAFESLFTSHAGFGGSRSEVFFVPSASRTPGTRTARPPTFSESHVGAGAGIGAGEEWGGSWRVGYDARSDDRRGATSLQSLEPRFAGEFAGTYRHPLLRGAGREVNLSPVREAGRLTGESELLLAREAELTVGRAEDAYWDLVGAIADRDLKRKSLEVARELHAVVRARVEGGRGIPVDVTEAVAGVARREVDLIAAENVVANAGDRLRALVLPFDGERPDLDLVVVPAEAPAAEVAAPAPPPGMPEIDAALRQRTDARAAALRLEAADLAESRAADDLLPALDAVVSGGLAGQGSGFRESSAKIGDRRAYRWDAGFELTVPLGNLVAEARARRAGRERERVLRETFALRNTVIREVREAARNVRSAADRIEAARRASAASREQLDAARSRLDVGRATPFDVLEAEEDLTKSAAGEVAASVDYEKARVAVLRATGSLLLVRGLAAAQPSE